MSVSLFVTPQRAKTGMFSVPARGTEDGVLVLWFDLETPGALSVYSSIAECPDARFGIVVAQI
jgi:polar amino acid transport system substrate-binding protein